MGAPVVLTQAQSDAINASLRDSVAAGVLPGAPGSNFWTNATTTQKALMVGGGLGATLLLYLALKPRRRR